MAKTLRSGHGKGARSKMLKSISDAEARKIVSAFKPLKTAPCQAAIALDDDKKYVLRFENPEGMLSFFEVRSSKTLKAG